MKGIALPIFHHTDQSATLKDCGVDYTIADNCEIRNIIFYNINAISEYFENENKYTSIHTNNSEYLCPMNIERVRKIIEDNNVQTTA